MVPLTLGNSSFNLAVRTEEAPALHSNIGYGRMCMIIHQHYLTDLAKLYTLE